MRQVVQNIIDILVGLLWLVIFTKMSDLHGYILLGWVLIGVGYLFVGRLYVYGILIGMGIPNDKEDSK